jgi:uncharacterized protein (TIGR03643 family)
MQTVVCKITVFNAFYHAFSWKLLQNFSKCPIFPILHFAPRPIFIVIFIFFLHAMNTATPNDLTTLSAEDRKSIIALAWNDRTPFDTIFAQFGVPEKDVRRFMRRSMKTSSFKLWRERLSSRVVKSTPPKPSA